MMRAGVLVAVLAVALAGCGRAPVSEHGTPYRDLEAGFALTVPAGWQATHGYGDVRLMLTPDGAGQAVRVSVLWDHNLDGSPPSLDEYVNFRLPRMGHFAKDRQLLHQERTAMNAEVAQAEKIDYRYTIGPGHDVQSRTWLMMTAHGGYALTLTADPERFDGLETVWQGVEKTFKTLN